MDHRMENTEEERPEKNDAKDSIMNKIQQLGETTLPQLPQDTNIHCLTIIGQIESMFSFLRKTKQQNMNMSSRRLWQLNKILKLKAC